MKVLYVHGDDYAALHIEDVLGVKGAALMASENGGELTIDNGEVYAELSIKEFGEVDPAFVSFVKYTLMDYDASKHENFFVIEEESE
jgi:hypothetical protein